MRRTIMSLIVAALVLTACASPAKPTAPPAPIPAPAPAPPQGGGHDTVFPDCFPFHSPMAQGPGPSTWGVNLQGPSPLFPGAPMRVSSLNWPVAAQKVKLFLLPRVENAMWYGRREDLAECLAPHAQLLATISVTGGHWEWTGKAPAAKAGERPALVAVDDSGLYFLEGLGVMGDQGANPPFRLTAVPVGAGAPPADAPAVQEVVVGEPFVITGSDLPIADGPVRISLAFHGWNGTDDVDLATAEVRGGRLDATVKVPPLVTADGGESAVLVPSDYLLMLTPPQRPFTYIYSTPLRLLPDGQDRATLAAFWRGFEAERRPDSLSGFPRDAGLAACRLHAGASSPDATCETQISAFDPRHDPAPPGIQRRENFRTVTLTAAGTDAEGPRTHIWSFVVDLQGQVVASQETGDPPGW